VIEVMVERAGEADLPAVLALLQANGLPLDGVAGHVATMVVARRRGDVVGVSALELYEDTALLRSVAVDPHLQGQGIGQMLTAAALRMARNCAVTEVFLLTTGAERFFPRFGFEPVSRDEVPTAVRASVEFTTACPASALAMRKRLDARGA
jgi:amino-acid N-acetyltransferase